MSVIGTFKATDLNRVKKQNKKNHRCKHVEQQILARQKVHFRMRKKKKSILMRSNKMCALKRFQGHVHVTQIYNKTNNRSIKMEIFLYTTATVHDIL